MAFCDALFDAYTLEGNFRVFIIEKVFFYDTSTENPPSGRSRCWPP